MTSTEFYLAPLNPPVCLLDARTALEKLSNKERLYVHWLSRASWLGSKATLHQVSEESPVIFDLLMVVFNARPVNDIRTTVVQQSDEPSSKRAKKITVQVSDEEFELFLQYAAQFFSNMGNYLSFGDTKFIPRISREKFQYIIENSPPQSSFSEESHRARVKDLLQTGVIDKIYSITDSEQTLGYPGAGVSSYYGGGVTKEEMDLVNSFMVQEKISPYNTRLFKVSPQQFELRIASANSHKGKTHTLPNKATIAIIYGDYSSAMSDLAKCLAKAREFCASPVQAAMLKHYEEHFLNGNIDAHKAAQKEWIKDQAPVIETNIGFIESYRDPLGVRGEFEGFVSVVNKDTSRKFTALVENAEHYLTTMPWPRQFEKDVFTRPDFTSLEVVSFTGSGIPAGINLPNYDDIRQELGFKNVSLQNVISAAVSEEKFTFLLDRDQEIYAKLRVPSFEAQVGCHELLGHGSGKLFMQNEDGSLNFPKDALDPLTKKPIAGYYKIGETYDSQFGSFGSSYEECRAEAVGLFLTANLELLRIFGHSEKQECEEIMYVNWLNMVRAGVLGLEFYTPEQSKWRQAHMQARFALLRVLLNAGQGLVSLGFGEGKDQVAIGPGDSSKTGEPFVSIDRSKILSVGVPAIGEFLLKLQVYKSTADATTAQKFYDDITAVPKEFLSLRDIVLAKKKPRRIFVQCHSEIVVGRSGGDEVVFEHFEPTVAGVVESFVRRFPLAEGLEVRQI